MDKVGGLLGVTAIAVVAILAVGFAILHFGFHVFRRRKSKGRSKSGILAEPRVEVLESTDVGGDRRLVLIRCDRIEHLIMVGGPADLVVENDVRKVRGPGAPPANVPGTETEKRAASMQRSTQPTATAPEPAIAPSAKPAEPQRERSPAARMPDVRPGADTRLSPTTPRGLPAVPAPISRPNTRVGEAPVPAAPLVRTEESGRNALPRLQPSEQKSGRREIIPARRPALTPTPASRAAEPLRAPIAANERNAKGPKGNGRGEPTSLPAAQIPWSDPDSIENEIVRALRFDPQTRSPSTVREAPSAKALTDSSTTLGDLADRLEEALAREMQAASEPQRAEPEVDFAFESEPARTEERSKPAAARDRQEKRERSEPARPTVAPEVEARREPPPAERREEAPVISLNSRRRETADQLEDEMARLLGELTSDTKGR